MCWICGQSGEAAFAAEAVASGTPQDFVLDGQKWGTSTLGTAGGTVTWSIVNAGFSNATGQTFFTGSTVSMSTVLNFDFVSVLNQAFAAWSAVANISFQFVTDGGGNIGIGTSAQIRVAAGFIDGPSSVLARAFNPGGSATNGDMVFDSGETTFWTPSSFLAVATHEIGHAIGIRHTSVTGSLMEPFYNPAITAPQADDIAAAQAIYGTRAGVAAGSVTIGDVAVTEGNAGTQVMTFTVTRSGGTAAFNVNYATANGTASAGSDYAAASGTLSFGANVNTQTVSIVVNGDTTVEANETFFVNLSAATNSAVIGDSQAVGTIIDNDGAATVGQVSISDVSVNEGNAGVTNATFTVTRTGGSAAFSVAYATVGNTATAGSDFTTASGTLNFGAGINSQTFSVAVLGDTLVEATESFFANLSGITAGGVIVDTQGIGTIVNDDVATGDDYADSRTDTTAPFGAIAVGTTSVGNLETVGDRDWFQLALSAGTNYRFELAGSDSRFGTLGDPYLRLYNSVGTLLAEDDDSGPGYESLIAYAALTSGTYYLEAGSFSDRTTGTYALAASATIVASDDYADSLTDTSRPFGSLALGASRTGDIETSGDSDWFRTTLTAGVQYSFDLIGAGSGAGTLADPVLSLYSATGALLVSNDDNGTSLESRVTFTPTTSGFYYVAANGYLSNLGTYSLSAVSGPFTNGNDVVTLSTPNSAWRALSGDDNVAGSAGADTIQGDAGLDTINGGAGNDYVEGGASGDVMNGGTDFDTVSWLSEAAAVAVNLRTGTYEYAAAGDSVTGFEVYYLTQSSDSFTNADTGGYIYGFNGDDFLFGGAGSDFLVGGAGADQVNGGAGFDYASFADANAGVTLDLNNPARGVGYAAMDRYFNVEAFFMSAFDDVFVGQNGANFAFGGNGNDALFGGLNANDWLFGEQGRDFLSGGTLDDLLVGGAGADVFAFASWVGNGFDVVLDFVPGEDVIALTGLGFGLLSGATFRNGVTFVSGTAPIYTAAEGTLVYYRPSGILYYDPDGSGANAAFTLAQFSGNPNLTADSFVVL